MKDLKKTLYLGLGVGIKLVVGLVAVKLCAKMLGPESFGLTGQISSLLSVVSLLAGAGVSVGITKIYAGKEFTESSRPDWIRAAALLAFASAVLLSALLLLFSSWAVQHLFFGVKYSHWLLFGLLVATFSVAFAAIGQGKINGSHRDDLYALSTVCGSLVGLLGLAFLVSYLGSTGAILGMIWLVVAQALSMCVFGKRIRSEQISNDLVPIKDLQVKARFLLKYGMLSITAGAVIPIVYIYVRLLVQEHNGNRIFGLWQATLRISEAYNQLPLLMLSVVLFARFSSTASESIDKVQVKKTYLFMVALMGCIACFTYLAREYWIKMVFTADFAAMEAFVPWQLAGDTLRILSYVGTTILAARGALKVCIAGEFMQGGLLLITNQFFVPHFPLNGAFYAYILTYLVYFALTLSALRRFSGVKFER